MCQTCGIDSSNSSSGSDPPCKKQFNRYLNEGKCDINLFELTCGMASSISSSSSGASVVVGPEPPFLTKTFPR